MNNFPKILLDFKECKEGESSYFDGEIGAYYSFAVSGIPLIYFKCEECSTNIISFTVIKRINKKELIKERARNKDLKYHRHVLNNKEYGWSWVALDN